MQKQNITLIIGDNATGKTRYLVEKIIGAQKNDLSVVTNIPKYKSYYAKDEKRFALMKELNNRLVNRIVNDGKIETTEDAYINALLQLFYSRGDILIIDEFDTELTKQNITDIAAALSEIRTTWRNIYITGYSEYITRVFTEIDEENYTESYTPRILYIGDKMKPHKVTEDTECEYFDKIRG